MPLLYPLGIIRRVTETPPNTPWYIEHRMRALLLLIAGFLAFGLAVASIVYVVTVSGLKKTVPFQMAVEQVAQHHAVISHLGQPVEPTWLAAGQVQEDTGYAEFTFRIAGPNGKGTVRGTAKRNPQQADSAWQLMFLDVATFSDFGVQTVEIINLEPPTGQQLPEPTPEAKEKYGVE